MGGCIQIFGVIHLGGRQRVLMQHVKAANLKPLREFPHIVEHTIHSTDCQGYDLPLPVILGVGLGNMDFCLPPHMQISSPNGALGQQHAAGEDGIKAGMLFKKVVCAVIDLVNGFDSDKDGVGDTYFNDGTTQIKGWEQGKKYTYMITFGRYKIFFTPSVSAWEDSSPFPPIHI